MDREYIANKTRPLADEEMSIDDEEGTQPGSMNNAPINHMNLQASKRMNSNSYYLQNNNSTIQGDTLMDFAQPMDLRYFSQNKRMSYDMHLTSQAPRIVPIQEPKKEDAFSHISVKAGHSQK